MLQILIQGPFRPYDWRGPPEPGLKRIVCQHGRMVQTAQRVGLNLSVPNTDCYSSNGWTASASPWAPTEMKERPEVTRDGNFRVARLNTSTFAVIFGCIVWQPVRIRRTSPTDLRMSGRFELSSHPYGWHGSCIRALSGLQHRGNGRKSNTRWRSLHYLDRRRNLVLSLLDMDCSYPSH